LSFAYVHSKEKMINTFKRIKNKIALLAIIIVLAGIMGCISPTGTTTGCGKPAVQGWSGFASANGILYIGSMDGNLLAIDPSARSSGLGFPGSENEWISDEVKTEAAAGGMCGPLFTCGRASTGALIYSSPVVSDEYVYVATYSGTDGQLYALYIEDKVAGELAKKYPVQGEGIGKVVGNMVIDEDTIYITSSNGSVYAIDTEYVVSKWETKITDERIWTSPAVSDGIVYVGSYDGILHALDAKDGSMVWEKELPSSMASSPVCHDDVLLFGAFDRYLYALDKTSGDILWQFKGDNWFWAAPVVQDNTVYAGCLDNMVYAVDIATGNEVWRFNAGDKIVSRPVITDNQLVVVSESGELYSLDASNGSLLKQVSIDATVMAPLYADGDSIYVHGRNHTVYAIDLQEARIVWELNTKIE
jgi:outer membrane protein assembly factor BamB